MGVLTRRFCSALAEPGSTVTNALSVRVLCNFNELCKNGQLHQVLEFVERRVIPLSRDNAYIFLQECYRKKDLDCARRLQSLMFQIGLDSVAVLGDYLIRLYAFFGLLREANEAFFKVTRPSVYTWSSIISAHVNLGQSHAAFELYSRMKLSGIESDRHVYLAVLKACIITSCLQQGRQIHRQIVQSGMQIDDVLGSTLVDMFAKCGSLEESGEVFERLLNPNIVTWGAMLSGCVRHGESRHALNCYKQMQETAVKPDKVIFLSVSKACACVGALGGGRHVHAQMLKLGLACDMFVGNALVDMYAKCGSLEDSCGIFDILPHRDVVSWNVLIAGYVQHSDSNLALYCFEKMQDSGVSPGKITFLSVLKACGDIGAKEWGRLIHDEILQHGLELDVAIGSSLVDMYGKCASLHESEKIFGNLLTRNVVSWSAMIAGYAQLGEGHLALQCFVEMQVEGVSPNKVTFLSVLKSCCVIEALESGRLIHSQVIEYELEQDVPLANTLVDMYAKCGSLEESVEVFDKILSRDVVSWNALIAGCTQQDEDFLALDCFEIMQEEGIRPSKVTFLSALKACGNLGAINQGRVVHDQIVEYGLEGDIILGSTLLDMYAKCGGLEETCRMFDKLPNRDLVSWNVLIAGCAQHGQAFLAFCFFSIMQEERRNPDKVTFLCTLVACCHAGLVDQGCWLFEHMKECHGIFPDMDHVTCMVNLLGRAGYLREAHELLEISGQPNVSGWKSLLNACALHGNADLGSHAFKKVVQLDPCCGPGYILMSNIYADAYI